MNVSKAFKAFFQPRAVVGLEVTETYIAAVQAINTLKGPELGCVAHREIGNPDEVVDACRELFAREDLKHEMLVTCLSGGKAFFRQVPIPFRKPRKLDRIIKFQMEPYLPVGIDRLVVDYLQPGDNGLTTAVGVEKASVAEHLETLQEAGLNPDVVTLDDLALYFLYRRIDPYGDDSPTAIVHRSPGKLGVQVIRQGRQELLRVVSNRSDAEEVLAETLKLYRFKNPESEVRRILVAGDLTDLGDSHDSAARPVSPEGIQVQTWSPFDAFSHRLGSFDPALQGRLSVALGLALSMCDEKERVPDLRREEFRTDSAMDLRRMMLTLVSGLLILGLIFGVHLHLRVAIQEARYETLKREIQSGFSAAFPDVRTVVKGRELVQMRQKIDAEREKFSWLEDLSGHGTVLETLSALTGIVSGFTDVLIEDFSVEGREVRLDGRASSFETVDKLKEKLSAHGVFETVKLSGAKMDKKIGAVRFNFGLEKKR